MRKRMPGRQRASRSYSLLLVRSFVRCRFAALTQELLSTVQKQSSLLRKMTKAPTASASTPGAMSDDDKILVQLYLDVQEFAKAMSECGVKISQLEDYQRLFACVADAEKVMPPRAVV